jgi:hypothetical protein
MSIPRVLVAVTLVKRSLSSRWASERWEPESIDVLGETIAPDAATSVRPTADGGWRFAPFAVELHRSEAEGYHLNLVAPLPKAFVLLRPAETEAGPPLVPLLVTVSYNEAARMLDGGESVEAVPLPASLHEWMRPFVEENYKPEPRKKVKRNDPFAEGAFRRDPRTGH